MVEAAADEAELEGAEASAAAVEPPPAPDEERRARRPRRRSAAKRGPRQAPAEPVPANGLQAIENGADHAGAASQEEWPSSVTTEAPEPPAVAAEPEYAAPTGASAEAWSEAGGAAPRATPERARDDLEATEAKVPSAAVVDPERPAAPRRGWWNRFVRKDE